MLYTAQAMIDAMLQQHFDAGSVSDCRRQLIGSDNAHHGRLARLIGRRFLPGLRGFGPGSAFDGVPAVRLECAR